MVTFSEEICVLDNKVRLLQHCNGFGTTTDAVMLAAACPAGAGDRVLDMGCGVGSASFCLLERLPEIHLTGIDIQQECVELAKDNAAINSKTRRCEFVCYDISEFKIKDSNDRFDHVICNPPYLESGQYQSSPSEDKAKALGHEGQNIDVSDWINCAFDLLKSRGSLTVIHRADAVDRIIRAMGKRFGAIEIIPLWPKQGVPAKRVIIRALKDRRSPATIYSGLILHNEDGSYTAEAEAILRGAEALS